MIAAYALSLILNAHFSEDISDYVQDNFQDASFRVHRVKGDQRELAKVNKSFGDSYRFQDVDVKLKEPFMLRSESNIEDTNILYIFNGVKRLVKIPKARITDRHDYHDKPGQRQTVFDFGILTPSLFQGLYDAKFVRTERATGDPVFDITYSHDDTSRSRIWIDREKHYIVKREWYNQVGRQLATFAYENPIKQNGVWIPTRQVVRNTDGIIAGVSVFQDVRVNSGLSKSLFNAD
jgi:outer membrane lipoprotein-sorting protein